MKRPIESEYTSHVAYARALEDYCDALAASVQEPLTFAELAITEIRLPKGMTSRFEGGVLIIESAHGITKGGEA